MLQEDIHGHGLNLPNWTTTPVSDLIKPSRFYWNQLFTLFIVRHMFHHGSSGAKFNPKKDI